VPGIAGIIRRHPYDGIDRDLGVMVQTLRHEEHHSGGHYVDTRLGLYVGWMSDEASVSERMPVVSDDSDVVLILHGERFGGDSALSPANAGLYDHERKAKHLVSSYLRLKERFFREMNGWFCGVIAERGAGRITVFNDRYGMARLYIHEGKEEVLFASEAKCLLAVRPELRQLSVDGLADFLRYNCVTGGRTLFQGVSLLPAASRWTFGNGLQPHRKRYFDFAEWEQLPKLPSETFYEHFGATVSRVIPDYAEPSGSVALSLTAGLDTRAIIAALKRWDCLMPCYTFNGAWGELFDVRTARKLAAAYGQPFESIRITEKFLKDFPELAARTVYVSDGTHDAFGAHDLYFNKLARCIAPARLTGKFGSEVVRTRKLMPLTRYADGVLESGLGAVVQRLPAFREMSSVAHPLTRMVVEEIPYHEYGRVAIEQSQISLRTPYMDNALVRLMFQAPDGVRAAGDLQERYVRDVAPELAVFPTNLGRFVASNRRLTGILYLGLRALFKIEYVYLYATPHWLTRLDRRFEGLHLERVLAGRQKWEGYRLWAKTHFSDFLRQTLLGSQASCAQYFSAGVIEKIVSRHLAGTHNYLSEINKILSLELIHASLLKSRDPKKGSGRFDLSQT
jgi:asparagine synthase (glutamine-hydrolysing)